MALVAFVVNRTLLRDPRRFLQHCRIAATDRGWDPWFGPAGGAQDSLALTRRAVAAGASLVFAAGGDGTVRACAEALAGTGVPLAIVPLGTANLTARALGVPSRGDRAVDAGFGGRDHAIDLGHLTLIEGGTWFTAMAGIGLDAAVVAAAGERLKRRLGWAAYAAAGVRRLGLPPREFTIRPDGDEPLRRRARSRGGGQRRAAARRVHSCCPRPGSTTACSTSASWRRRAAGTGSGWPDGCWPGTVARIGRWGACRRAASRSAPIPSCRGRSTARSSRPAGRSPSRCAREPWSFGCRDNRPVRVPLSLAAYVI